MNESPVAIVTGAGSGIGAATCLLLAAEGYRIGLVGRTESKLASTEKLIAGKVSDPPELRIIPTDITRPQQAIRAVDAVVERWGRLDVLVNNAGGAKLASIGETAPDLLGETFALNALAPGYLIARAWSHLEGAQERGYACGGCIVNISSMATTDPFFGLFAYAAAKSAVESYSRSIANEGAASGVRGFSIAPGAVETALLRGLFSFQEIPPGSTLAPELVAKVVIQCIQGEREADNGSTIHLPSP